jgi:sulfoxide reductase heme-binding subunit YedZ
MTPSPPRNRFDLVGRILKPAVFILCLLPVAILGWKGIEGSLSANPIADITNETGIWTLRLLVVTLAITPLRKLTGWAPAARFRRMVGVFAFFYAALHFTTYIYLDKFFDLADMISDVTKRKFIMVGFASFVMLIPLALTSTNRATRWLGGKRWQQLHRLVYLIGIGGVIHYLWRVKADHQPPLIYGGIVLALLLFRLWTSVQPSLAARFARKQSAIE